MCSGRNKRRGKVAALGDLGSLQGILQGLITISIGALIGINTFELHLSSGHTVSIIGNSNTVSIIHNNLYHSDEYRLSFGFRIMWLLSICLCVLLPWMQRFLQIENLVISIPLIFLAFLGMITSPTRIISGLYVVTAVIFCWFIVTNYGLMYNFYNFVGTHFFDQNLLQDALSRLNFTALFNNQLDPLLDVISILMAIYGITFLLLIQLKNAFSFLRYQREFDDVLKSTVKNIAMSFIMILLASGVVAAFSNPSLLWPSVHDSHPLYYTYWLIKLVLYHTLPLAG
jgi:hypothetical protein